MLPTSTVCGSAPSGVGSPSGCCGGESPVCGCRGSVLGRGSPSGVAPGVGPGSPEGGTGVELLSPPFLAFFFFGFFGSFFGLAGVFGLAAFFGFFGSFFGFLAGVAPGSDSPVVGAAGRFLGLLTKSSRRFSSCVDESLGDPPSRWIGSSSESSSSQ